jgi:hypothetical protein
MTSPNSANTDKAVNLKEALFNLGNRLVLEEGLTPSIGHNEEAEKYASTTFPIAMFTAWLNKHPEAQDILREQGINWGMP